MDALREATSGDPATALTDPAGAQPTIKSSPPKTGVVIVGGGPAGLAAALMLARRGWRGITVLERSDSLRTTDPDRSYVYNIDGRGRRFTDALGLSDQLPQAGVGTNQVVVTRVFPNGKVVTVRQGIKDDTKVTHWMPRAAFMGILEDAVRTQGGGAIDVRCRSSVLAVRRAEDGGASASGGIIATVRTVRDDGVETDEELRARLLIGADGINSMVRRALTSWPGAGDGGDAGNFGVTQLPSLSTGLRFKVLRLPPNPSTRKGERLANSSFCLLAGQASQRLGGAAAPLRLGLLPIKDPAAPRTANLITLPDHPIWDISDAEGMYVALEQALPQMDWRSLVPQDTMAAFAASTGGSFPAPQHCRSMQLVLPADAPGCAAAGANASQRDGDDAASGVLLLGDALHCFPPDLGQGVNSALEDIMAFDESLAAADDNLAAALPEFEAARMPDVRALVKLVQIGYPLQYNQYPLQRTLWNLGFLLQMAMHKLLPFFIAPPLFMMVQDPAVSYSRVLQLTQQARTRLAGLLALITALAAVLVARALRFGASAWTGAA